jgi:hypothetical protein
MYHRLPELPAPLEGRQRFRFTSDSLSYSGWAGSRERSILVLAAVRRCPSIFLLSGEAQRLFRNGNLWPCRRRAGRIAPESRATRREAAPTRSRFLLITPVAPATDHTVQIWCSGMLSANFSARLVSENRKLTALLAESRCLTHRDLSTVSVRSNSGYYSSPLRYQRSSSVKVIARLISALDTSL